MYGEEQYGIDVMFTDINVMRNILEATPKANKKTSIKLNFILMGIILLLIFTLIIIF